MLNLDIVNLNELLTVLPLSPACKKTDVNSIHMVYWPDGLKSFFQMIYSWIFILQNS